MQKSAIVTAAFFLVPGEAFCQGLDVARLPAKPATAITPTEASNTAAHTAAVKTSVNIPESRSAAALKLSDEPTFEGTAQRIKEAALSYSDLAVRGGWPTIPTDVKFVVGTQGLHDELLRRRLIITGDLAPDKASGPYDDVLAQGVKRFQLRHGLAATGNITRSTQCSRDKACPAVGGLTNTSRQHGFSVWTTLRRREYSGDVCGSDRK